MPFSRTVWYTIEGAGAPITIDTAGSDFDTVIAVYVKDDQGAFVEVACVDAVFFDHGSTIQASLTGDAEAGVTYWIQVGGWNTSGAGWYSRSSNGGRSSGGRVRAA